VLDVTGVGSLLISDRAVLAARAATLVDLGRMSEALDLSAAALLARGEDAWSGIDVLRVRGDVLSAAGLDLEARRVWSEALTQVDAMGIEALRAPLEQRLAG
jgi:predicted negative regulator of RcsB-dependent stress response